MRKIAIVSILLILMFSGTQAIAGQWIGCNLAPENEDADPNNDVIAVVILKDGVESVVPYNIDVNKNKVRILDITPSDSGIYQFAFQNSQGRRGNFVSFDLAAAPDGCSEVKLYSD